ncbi:MAG: hypothetical protein V1837_06055 [Candidatus Woesearchaeota archaeon]
MQKPSESKESQEIIEFISRPCPKCKKLLAVKKLGVWGYYCTDCMMWWGTIDPYPKVRKK